MLASLNVNAQWYPNTTSPILQHTGFGNSNIQVLGKDTVLMGLYSQNPQNTGLYRTTDNGSTWQLILNFWLEQFQFNNYNHGICRSGSFLQYTSNAGLIWDTIWQSTSLKHAGIGSDSTIYTLHNGNYSFIPGSYLMLKSINAGLSWDTIFLPETSSNKIGFAASLNVYSEDSLAFLAYRPLGTYVYTSSDGGLSWQENLINCNVPWIAEYNILDIVNDSTYLIIGGNSDTLMRTTNKGLTVSAVYTSPDPSAKITDVSVVGEFVAVACTTFTNANDSTLLIARSNDIMQTYIHDTIRNYSQFSCTGIGAIDLLTPNYGWTSSYEQLYFLDDCNIQASYSYQLLGNGLVAFTNTSSGQFTDSYWAFGDGSTATVSDTSHFFSANGSFVVVLAIQKAGAYGPCYDYYIDTIQVSGVSNPVNCQAGFVVFPDSNTNMLTIINSSVGSNLSYSWDFGDGNISNIATPTHTYTSNGPYNLCLTVNDGSSCLSTYCDSVQKTGVRFNKSAGFTINVASLSTTSIEKLETDNIELMVYPNPAKQELIFEILSLPTAQMLEVYNINGILIQEKIIDRLKTSLDVSEYTNGVYFLRYGSNYKSFVISK